ncbi:MAG TPA: glycosyltransferase family 4 protein [Ktedonobacterales bacterium]
MRILHVETLNQVAESYIRGLDRLGHTSTIFRPSLVGAGRPLPIKMALMPARVVDLGREARRLNAKHYDIMHINWATYGILGLASRVPFIVHCHGSDIRPYEVYPKGDELGYRTRPLRSQAILAHIFRRAAAVLVITPDLLPIARAMRPDAMFLPGPVDTHRFSPADDLTPHPFTVLHFARLAPEKGNPVALEGMMRFKARHPEVRLWAMDNGPLAAAFKGRYGEGIEFLTNPAPDHTHELLRQADVITGQFVLGALGLSELQGMSCAKPVIVSSTYPEAYATPPPLCHATSPDHVAAHLESLYRDRQAARLLGQQAREWVIAEHDVDRLALRLESLYRSVIETSSRRRSPTQG